MDILLIGGGGREAALAWKLAQSPRVNKLYCAPGNHGISQYASCFPIAATDLEGILDLAKTLAVDLVFVGPDDPLAMGLIDRLEADGIRAFGPRANAAQLEASKIFGKSIMKKMRIPTAKYNSFSTYSEALAYAESCTLPQVVKADGLALGKGVVVCHSRKDLIEATGHLMQEKRYGDAGKTILFEEFLEGEEFTLLAFTDGISYSLMPPVRDHKRAYDDDRGPNTGGMGAVVPGIELHPSDLLEIEDKIVKPTLEGLRLEGIDYKGVIYFGLISTVEGVKVIEYNARFGDPECQALMPLLESDLAEIARAILSKRLDKLDIKWKKDASACVVLASGGYPGTYSIGLEIKGLKDIKDVYLFEAGTRSGEQRKVLTGGGRVLSLVACAADLDAAIKLCYQEVDKISFEGMMLRRDIGRHAIKSRTGK